MDKDKVLKNVYLVRYSMSNHDLDAGLFRLVSSYTLGHACWQVGQDLLESSVSDLARMSFEVYILKNTSDGLSLQFDVGLSASELLSEASSWYSTRVISIGDDIYAQKEVE